MAVDPNHDWGWVADAIMLVWYVLLFPWLLFAMLSGMAFDARPAHWPYIFVSAVWVYPISVVVAAKLREKYPSLVLLPLATTVFGIALTGAVQALEQ